MFFDRVGLEEALTELMQRNAGPIYTIDDAMRQFASEPGAPKGDYRIVEKNKRNPQRAYVVKRIQEAGGFAAGGVTPKGKRQEPRQAQRIVAQGVKEPRSVTAPRWALIQHAARRSWAISTLERSGTTVHMRAQFTIIDSDGNVDDRPIRTIFDVYVPGNKRASREWDSFIEQWRNGKFDDATQHWELAYFMSFLSSGIGTIEDVEWLVMEAIATRDEMEKEMKVMSGTRRRTA